MIVLSNNAQILHVISTDLRLDTEVVLATSDVEVAMFAEVLAKRVPSDPNIRARFGIFAPANQDYRVV